MLHQLCTRQHRIAKFGFSKVDASTSDNCCLEVVRSNVAMTKRGVPLVSEVLLWFGIGWDPDCLGHEVFLGSGVRDLVNDGVKLFHRTPSSLEALLLKDPVKDPRCVVEPGAATEMGSCSYCHTTGLPAGDPVAVSVGASSSRSKCTAASSKSPLATNNGARW